VPEPSHAVFLSYASQDAAAAQKIAEGLRAGGIEVFLDQSELRGGDVWDQKIRRQIHDCALFIPVISANTASRREGYFRLEWDLADQRSHMMARDQAFIVPVCLDATPGAGTDVPESFHRVQWTRLPAGETPPAFVERVRRLVSPAPSTSIQPATMGISSSAAPSKQSVRPSWQSKPALLVMAGAAVLVLLAYLAVQRFWLLKQAPPATASATISIRSQSPAAPDKSIAVLPFADMSEKHDQEYFADGLAEELLDLLAKTPGLHVIARTSSFSFKGKSDDIPSIAAKLKVGSILEGSVRRSGNRLRVTTQLVRAENGEHIWSETYDREIQDLFKVQDDIANEVVRALKVKLDVAAAAERAPTDNMAAHNFLLEGRFFMDRWAAGDPQRAITSFENALKEDPNYALAWAELSWAEMWFWQEIGGAEAYHRATHAALHAIELRPDLAQAHATRGWCESLLGFDWAIADMEFSKALALDPQNMRALYGKGRLARVSRRPDEALHYYQLLLERDPVNAFFMEGLVQTLVAGGKTADAVRASRKVFDLSPSMTWSHWVSGYALLWNGELEAALMEMRLEPAKSLSLSGIALIEEARHNRDAADAALRDLLAIEEASKPYFVAEVYAARGDSKTAITWLERARVARVGWFGEVTVDPAFNAIRGDPAFAAYLRRMKLPG